MRSHAHLSYDSGMAINYASENLYKAVLYCMRSTQPLQEKLEGCYSIFHVLSQKGDLPPNLQERFDAMIHAWTRVNDPTGKLGTVHVTTSKMDDNECSKWLEEIISLYDEVEILYNKDSQQSWSREA